MDSIIEYNEMIKKGLNEISFNDGSDSLYAPVKYFLDIGGKRVRPILTLMSCSCFRCNPKLALNAALTVELFHNFTLIHDDIMDSANSRRGKETIHKKWGINSAILSGDVMLIMAYQLLENYEKNTYTHLNKLLNKTAREVCEGQRMDMDFESKSNVSFDQYIKMVSCKTAVLLGCALKMGAIVANASIEDQENIYQFGINLGLAFQLLDDYLDTFGEENIVGKKIGGDIIKNKIAKTTLLFKESKADISSLELVDQYTKKAIDSLNKLSINQNYKNELIVFANNLMKRDL